MTFADRLRSLREAAKLTRQELGNRALPPMHRVVIGRYETDQRQPTFDAACRLADALGVPVDALRPTKDLAEKVR